ncbi:DUF4446 family protein [Kytococcus sp. Marseille-QA3725]
MPEPVQSSLLIAATVCAVLALAVGVWLALQVSSLRRHRFVSPRVLAGDEGDGPQRRSMSSRQGGERRYAAPAVRTGVDSTTMKRALDRANARQEKSLSRMRAEIEEMQAEIRKVSSGFSEVRKQASTDTQSIRQVHGDATKNLDRMGSTVSALEKKVGAATRDMEQRVGAAVSDMDQRVDARMSSFEKQIGSDLRELDERVTANVGGVDERLVSRTGALDDRLAALSREVEELESRRAALADEAAADRKRLDTVDRGLGGVAGLVDGLRTTTSEHDSRTTALDERLGNLGGSVEKHGQRLEELEGGATQLTERTSGLDRALQQLTTHRDEHGQRIEHLEGGATQLTERTSGLDQALRTVSDHTDNINARLKHLEHDSESALTEVALVRYDAFGDMGGRMSFSVALLDSVGDGLIITSLNGRAHSQTYAKSVTEGRGTTQLTAEEMQAVEAARGMDTTQTQAQETTRPLRQRR